MRKIIHVDMDCFFAAIEMRDNTIPAHIPLAVGGSRERGVICSANYKARRFGIHSAMSSKRALMLCPELRLIEPRHAQYQSISQSVMHIFERYSAKVEPIALDEAYLDVTESSLCQGSATLIAQNIRADIQSTLQLTASAGVAPNKFLAKIASSYNKPNGLFVIRPNQVSDFVASLQLQQIPGVGKVTLEKLHQLGLYSCRDYQGIEWQKLQSTLGKFAFTLQQRCQGIDNREVECEKNARSIGVEHTVQQDLYDLEQILAIFNQLFDKLTARLLNRRSDLRIAKQGIKFKFSDFQLNSREQTRDHLNKIALQELLQQLWSEKSGQRGVRLVGLFVTLVHPQLDKQLFLDFESQLKIDKEFTLPI